MGEPFISVDRASKTYRTRSGEVKADALAYELNEEFAAVPIPEGAGFTEADFEG